MAHILLDGLSTSGICRNIAREVLHGPNDEHGLDILNLYLHQGFHHMEYDVNHIQDSVSILGILLCTSMQQTKVEIGTGQLLFIKIHKQLSLILTPP